MSADEAAGHQLSTTAILSGLGVIAIRLFVQVGTPRLWYHEAILALFALLTLANHSLASGTSSRRAISPAFPARSTRL